MNRDVLPRNEWIDPVSIIPIAIRLSGLAAKDAVVRCEPRGGCFARQYDLKLCRIRVGDNVQAANGHGRDMRNDAVAVVSHERQRIRAGARYKTEGRLSCTG